MSLRGDVPTNREKLIAQAVRIKNHFKNYREERGRQGSSRKESRNRSDYVTLEGSKKRERSKTPPEAKSSSPTTRTNTVRVGQSVDRDTRTARRRPNVTCFKCNKEGHYASLCPELTCHNYGEVGHKTFGCPKPKRQGNDRA